MVYLPILLRYFFKCEYLSTWADCWHVGNARCTLAARPSAGASFESCPETSVQTQGHDPRRYGLSKSLRFVPCVAHVHAMLPGKAARERYRYGRRYTGKVQTWSGAAAILGVRIRAGLHPALGIALKAAAKSHAEKMRTWR